MNGKKSIKKNYLYNLTYTLLNTALPLLTAPYLARVVGAEGVGTYAYYYAIAHIFYIFAKLGLNNYGTRQISAVRDGEKLSETFSSIYYQQFLTALFSNIIYWIFCFVFLGNEQNQIYAIILGILVFAGFFDIDWLFSGMESFATISRKNIVVKVISVCLIFIFVKSSADLWKYVTIMACSMLFGYLSMWLNLKKVVTFKKVALKDVLMHLKPNLVLVIPVFSISIYRQMDKIMLGAMTTLAETGLYENAEKVIYALCGFITAFGTVMMPRISNMISNGKEKESTKYLVLSMQFMMFMMFAMTFGLCAVAKPMAVVLFGNEFGASGILMEVLAFTLPFIGWANVIRSQFVIPKGRDYIYIATVITGAILNIIINAICIPKLGALGATIGTIFAEGSIPVTQYIFLHNEVPYKDLIKKSIPACVCGLMMFLVVKAVSTLHFGSTAVMLIVEIVVGIVTYGLIVLIFLFFFEKGKL